MKKYKREFELIEKDEIETFFPVKKSKTYKKKGVQGYRGNTKTETLKK